jgi:amidophosphoribosyltransferase
LLHLRVSLFVRANFKVPDLLTISIYYLVCGILGLLLHDASVDAAPEISEGLSLLQHRGQDACGIVTCGPKGRFFQCKANGMVRDVFDENAIAKLIGGMGVGHGRQSPCRT